MHHQKMNKRALKVLLGFMLAIALMAGVNVQQVHAGLVLPEVNINIAGAEGDMPTAGSVSLQILFLSVFIALLPSLLVVMTGFTRIVIVFSFARSALGTQQMPPNQVLIGLALMLTLFIMNPEITRIMEYAFTPLAAGEITQAEAVDLTMDTLRGFMIRHASPANVNFFAGLSGQDFTGYNVEDLPSYVIIPAFILTELTTGFWIGVLIYIPFIVIDMVVASVLMAMGMMMLPPAMISLPFKVLLFVLVDGWRLLIEGVIATFISPPFL